VEPIERPLRADALRNRRAILSAAGDVFAREGTGVTLEHIAESAGVGVGTIYRRFRSVEDLVAVVMEEKMRAYADEAERTAELGATDPWQAFREFVMFMLAQQADDVAFSDVILNSGLSTELFRAESLRALRASQRLVAQARLAMVIRPDFDHTDLLMVLHANAGVVRGMRSGAPVKWERFAEYALQAFRHDPAQPSLPPAPAHPH
jgi:AcrR family transcriptional regulator